MAKFFCRVSAVSRTRGSRATRAAAYRAGERIRDERTSASYNHSDRQDIVHKEITLPSDLANRPDMEWARDRARLWNAVETQSDRRNLLLAREVLVNLPWELTPAQRVDLARAFSRELAEKYRNAVDLAVHLPRPDSDERNHHAHILMTTREVTPEGLGPRITLELSRTDFSSIRERWAELMNGALLEAGIQERVDHHRAQGLDRALALFIPRHIFYVEKRLGRSIPAGDEIRARHRERVEASLKGKEALAQVLRKQKEEARQRAIERERLPKKIPYGALTRDELNALRRQQYPAKKDAINQKHRERLREIVQVDGQAKSRRQIYNEKRREQRRTLSEEQRERINAERRLQYRERVAAKKALAQGATQTPQPSHSPTAEESAKNWAAYRKTHGPGPTAEESAKNWLAYRKTHGPGPTAEESAKNWAAYRKTHGPGPTAEESAKNWLAYRETHGPGPTAEESAKNWLAYRNSQQQQNSATTTPNDRTREHGDSSSKDNEAHSKRDLDLDLSL